MPLVLVFSRRRRHSRYWRDWSSDVCFSDLRFFFQAEDGIRDIGVTGVQTCALPIFASMRNLEIWYAQLEAEPALERFGSQLRPGARKSTRREIAKAYTDDNLTAFAKLTQEREGKPRIVANPPLIVPVSELATPGSGDLVFAQLKELLGA